MQSDVVLKFGNRTGDQVVSLFDATEKTVQPTIGDLLYAGQRQRSRILQRTARGVDVNDTAFSPYSLNGPVYYYPGNLSNTKQFIGPKTKIQAKAIRARELATKRIGDKLGLSNQNSRTVVRTPGARNQYVQKTGRGLKFSSYAALKAAFGRNNVDLRGLRAPHMLQAMIVRVQEFVLGNPEQAFQPIPDVAQEPASEVTIGIYGQEAQRARGHQNGIRHLPKRKFIGANDRDREQMLVDISIRIQTRVRKLLGRNLAKTKEDSL